MKTTDIGFEQAYKLSLEHAAPIRSQILPIRRAVGRVLAEAVTAKASSPSVNASLKDGYAVVSADLADARPDHPVQLDIIGSVAAGARPNAPVARGQAMRILSGAPLPEGAEAVLAEEFASPNGQWITARATAAPGRNVQPKGEDVFLGEKLAEAGDVASPQLIALLVAGGISALSVYQMPRVGLLATGSEILAPGRPPADGKLYASNAALQQAWLNSEGMDTEAMIAADSFEGIARAIRTLHAGCDVVVTSGGAWKGDRDLVVKVLDSLGWEMFFHRARMGPGKAIAVGRLAGKLIFCLPGGPASNATAFIMIVFPAILKMSGLKRCPYLYLSGRLENDISGSPDWTQFIQCEISQTTPEIRLRPSKIRSRLAAMTKTPAVVKIPEGVETVAGGSRVPFLCLDRRLFEWPVGGSF